MSYRKLKIEDKIYEYIIGKKFTKVKHDGKAFGIYPNDKHGNPVTHPESTVSKPTYFVVTPLNVKHMILGLPLPEFNTPEGKTTYLMVDPYKAEICQRIVYIACSKHNYRILCDEI